MGIARQPIIIIGMHRSGTSMIARMLRDLGLFIGRDLEDNNEATFFVKRNDKILNICNATWDNPDPIEVLLNHSPIREQITKSLLDDLRSFQAVSFMGPKYFLKYTSVLKFDLSWGWKDPRNTFLLPLWLDIFPNAKIIHIYRNGIDVAKSLSAREFRRINNVNKNDRNFFRIIKSQKQQVGKTGFLLYLIRKLSIRYEKMDPLYKYNKFRIHSVKSLQKGFELWCNYMQTASRHLENISNDILHIKYEHFLLEPEHWLQKLNEFCDLTGDHEKIKSLSTTVNPRRRYAFMDDPSLINFYNQVKNNYYMRRLGYCDL